jgi:hypothetical protein
MKTEKRSEVIADDVPRVNEFPFQCMSTGSPAPEPHPPVEHPTIHPSLELERYTDSRVAEAIPVGVGGTPVKEISVPRLPTAQPLVPANETEFKSCPVPDVFCTSVHTPLA